MMSDLADAATLQVSVPTDLPRLTAFVEQACDRVGADADSRFALRLAVEESFTNILQHGYGAAGGAIMVYVQARADRVAVTLRDRAPPFAPHDAPAADISAHCEDREAGGLGWHLVQAVLDEARYERTADDENVLTLVKYLSSAT